MTLPGTLAIRSPVGFGATNNRDDVRTVQQLLNHNSTPPRRLLAVDGIFGPKTRAAIEDFQVVVVRMARADGRVDPGRNTIRLLKDPQTKMVWSVSVGTQTLATTTRFQDEMLQEFAQKGKQNEWQRFWDEVVVSSVPDVKMFIGTLGRAEDARSVVRFYLQLREWGHSSDQILQCFKYFMKLPNRDVAMKMIAEASKPASGVGRMLSLASQAGAIVGFVAFLVEYVEHWRKGDYHMAFVEVYKAGMGKAVGWAAIVEGLQSLIGAIAPNDVKANDFFKILHAFDPIGLGGVAVDTVGAFMTMLLEAKWDGARLARLSARMHEGPTRIFAEIGDDLGDALATMSQWSPQEWDEALSISSLTGFARYLVTGKMPDE